MVPHDLAHSELVFAIPVFMPVAIAWLPLWSMATFSSGAGDE
jgi:hypothetical protein